MIDYNTLPVITKEDKPKTSCAKCVFKIEENDKQVGCRFNNRIDRFIEMPAGKVWQEKKDNKTYCLIDRLCTACVKDMPEVEDDVAFVRDKLKAQMSIIIFIDDDSTKEQILKTYLSAIDQEVAPSKVIISYNKSCGLTPQELYRLLNGQEFVKYKPNMVLVQHVIEKSWDEEFLTCAGKCDTPYFTFFEAGQQVPYNLIAQVDKLVNDDLVYFMSIKVPPSEGTICGTILLSKLFMRACRMQKTDPEYEEFDVHDVIYNMTSEENGVLTWNL